MRSLRRSTLALLVAFALPACSGDGDGDANDGDPQVPTVDTGEAVDDDADGATDAGAMADAGATPDAAVDACAGASVPLTLDPVDLGATFAAPVAGYADGCAANAGHQWCALESLATYKVPECAEGAALTAIVDHVLALAADPALVGVDFASGEVLTAAQLGNTTIFGDYASDGGPALRAALDGYFGGAPEAWLLVSPRSCHNCTETGYTLVLWYPASRGVVVLGYHRGYDS